jgi:hypothetical protein
MKPSMISRIMGLRYVLFGALLVIGLFLSASCDPVKWATIRVRNLSVVTMQDVHLIGVEPVVSFGYCPPDADKSTCLTETIVFRPDVAIEYSIDGKVYRQPLNGNGGFPGKLRNRNVIIELQFTTDRVWTWTMKKGQIVK